MNKRDKEREKRKKRETERKRPGKIPNRNRSLKMGLVSGIQAISDQ